MAVHTPEYPNRVYKHPKDYFQENIEHTQSVLVTPFMYGVGAAIGLGATLFLNYANKRPSMSGIHRHVGSTCVGLLISHLFLQWRHSNTLDRDAAIRHYIEMHPEDFPPFERRQYKDIFRSWIPYR